MFNRLHKGLLHLFVQDEEELDPSVLHAALWQALHLPYFENGYAHVELAGEAELGWRVQIRDHRNYASLVDLFEDLDWDSPWFERQPKRVEPTAPLQAVSWLDVDPVVRDRANVLVKRLFERDPSLKKLAAPSPMDLSQRRQWVIEGCDDQEVHRKLVELLGEDFGVDLLKEGIPYFDCRWSATANKLSYFLAHNHEGVAGVLGYQQKEHEMVLSFVAVAPAFRQQGLSLQLYQHLVDLCVERQCYLSRTKPGIYTRSNPEITGGYNRWLRSQPVLHVTDGGYLQGAMKEGLDALGYERFFTLAKPVCDERTLLPQENDPDYWEREAVRKWKTAWKKRSSMRR